MRSYVRVVVPTAVLCTRARILSHRFHCIHARVWLSYPVWSFPHQEAASLAYELAVAVLLQRLPPSLSPAALWAGWIAKVPVCACVCLSVAVLRAWVICTGVREAPQS